MKKLTLCSYSSKVGSLYPDTDTTCSYNFFKKGIVCVQTDCTLKGTNTTYFLLRNYTNNGVLSVTASPTILLSAPGDCFSSVAINQVSGEAAFFFNVHPSRNYVVIVDPIRFTTRSVNVTVPSDLNYKARKFNAMQYVGK